VDEEFRDIPISDVEIIFSVVTPSDGKRTYSTGIQYSRPLPLKVYGIWALHYGISAPRECGVVSMNTSAPHSHLSSPANAGDPVFQRRR
jgi:hypothetical protein